jgi:deoxycytidylate deaminase
MNVEGLLSDKIKRLKNMQERVNKIMSRRRVRDSQVMDIIEFGRIIHAEMSAISDAARLGRATLHGTLFSTTFPCHMCARHIVAAGITRVVFLEPYPKSYAQKLHEDSITFEADHSGKVLFQPFIGISPRRYRDIFERRKKRKDEDGKIILWQEGKPAPLVEDRSSLYIDNEPGSIYVTLRKFRENATRTRRKARTRS